MKNKAIELYDEEGSEFIVNKQRVKLYQKNLLDTNRDDDVTLEDQGEVTLYLMRRSLEVLRKFHWTILGGRFNQKHFKTLSLDKLRSPDFNLFSDQENSEEEVAETMAETMEQYMSKTRADYGSGVARPKIKDKDNFKLKGQFLKKLRTNTFNCSDHEYVNEHIEKVLKIVDLFYIPNITIDQSLDSRGAIPSKTAADAKVAIQEMAEYSQKWHNGTSRSRSTKTSDGLAAIQAQLNNLWREIKKVNEKVYAAQVGCEQCKGPHYTKDCPLKEEEKTLKEAYYT
ncbi:homeodomain-like protein [Tanacetum coccineum]|uniref:Homeodomain-like protein n=1 Tax=Tanacetum coccineum TaxID=301880 RepID=A0ABQ5FH11_9ASTR